MTVATSLDYLPPRGSFTAGVRSVSRLLPARPDAALERLVYRSRATEAYCGPAHLAQLLRVATRNNQANRMTGALALSDQTFVQVVEGPAARLNELLVRLGRDSRHSDLDLLGRWSITSRLFGCWAMAPADLADASPRVHRRFRSDGLGSELVGMMFAAADAACPLRP